MKKQSAGVLMYRRWQKEIQVLLVHPGGPFWSKKDEGAWTIPKGEFNSPEDPLEAAKREFMEETGMPVSGVFKTMTPVKQKSGKMIYAFCIEGDLDIKKIRSNTFELEWPPHSRQIKVYPEIDRAEWFTIREAMKKINAGQVALLDELEKMLS